MANDPAPHAPVSNASPSISSPPKSNARSKIALLLLLLVAAVIGYGVFERVRLLAAVQNERIAAQALRDLKGMPVESSVQDWRVVFVPDQPQLAMRIGGIYVANEGNPPDYTKKLIEMLRAFECCKDLTISDGPLSGAMRMGPSTKRVLQPGETPPELLDLAAIRAEFPHLTIKGEEYLRPSYVEASEAPKNEEQPPPAEGEEAQKTTEEQAKP